MIQISLELARDLHSETDGFASRMYYKADWKSEDNGSGLHPR